MDEMPETTEMVVMANMTELAEWTKWNEVSLTAETNKTLYSDNDYYAWIDEKTFFWFSGILLVVVGTIGILGNIFRCVSTSRFHKFCVSVCLCVCVSVCPPFCLV